MHNTTTLEQDWDAIIAKAREERRQRRLDLKREREEREAAGLPDWKRAQRDVSTHIPQRLVLYFWHFW